jgi:hypothetical protein
MENNIHSHGSPPSTPAAAGSPPGSPSTPPTALNTMNQITTSNSKTNFINNFEEVELFNTQLPNNSDSVGKPLSEILTPTDRLNLYRAGSIARNNKTKIRLIERNDNVDNVGNVGISFYGTSRNALTVYDKKNSNTSKKTNKLKKTYYRMVLSKSDTEKLVDLHLPENTNRILRFLLSQNSDEDKRILIKTLFYESDINNFELIRHSKNVDEDVMMTRILMRIFPDAIGTYTRQGSGLSHNEVIIWNRSINEKLQKVNNKTKKRTATSPRSGNRNENGNGNGNVNNRGNKYRRTGNGPRGILIF